MLERHINEPQNDGDLVLLKDDHGIIGLEVPRICPMDGRCVSYQRIVTAPRAIDVPEDAGLRTDALLHTLPRNFSTKGSVEGAIHADAWQSLTWRARVRTGTYDLPRQQFWGLRAQASRIANAALAEIYAVADQDALRIARRFPRRIRGTVYSYIAGGPRLRQFAETFPFAAILVFLGRGGAGPQRENRIRQLVSDGAPLKHVARELDIPLATKRIPPGATADAVAVLPILRDNPHLIGNHMPRTTAAIRRWLIAIQAARTVDGPFVEWTARNADRMGNRINDVRAVVEDLGDFVTASYQLEAANLPAHILRAVNPRGDFQSAQYVRRPFEPSMSLRTVLDLSHEWHEAIAQAESDGDGGVFPDPLIPGGAERGIEITPIRTALELYHEGRAMKHCVNSFRDRIRAGHAAIYSARIDGERVATIEVQHALDAIELGQVRGPCNQPITGKTLSAIKSWFTKSKKQAAKQEATVLSLKQSVANVADAEMDIPF